MVCTKARRPVWPKRAGQARAAVDDLQVAHPALSLVQVEVSHHERRLGVAAQGQLGQGAHQDQGVGLVLLHGEDREARERDQHHEQADGAQQQHIRAHAPRLGLLRRA